MIENISNKINVLIYGAGEAGRQLKISLKKNPEFIVQGFLDDNKKLEQKNLLGKKIYPSSKPCCWLYNWRSERYTTWTSS